MTVFVRVLVRVRVMVKVAVSVTVRTSARWVCVMVAHDVHSGREHLSA